MMKINITHPTKSCLTEIEKVTEKMNDAQQNETEWTIKAGKATGSEWRVFLKERNRFANLRWRYENKVKELKEQMLSTKELNGIKKEMSSFRTISNKVGLGSRDIEAIGYSQILNSYIYVSYVRFTDFMRNVKGCESIAGSKDIHELKMISEHEFQKMAEVK